MLNSQEVFVSGISGDTEYFNGKEWKYISQYAEDDKVLQYNEDGSSTLVALLGYGHNRDKSKFYENDSEWLPSKFTGNHGVVYWVEGERRLAKAPFINIFDSISRGEQSDVHIPVTTEMKDSEDSIVISDNILQSIIRGYKDSVIPKDSCANQFLRKVGFRKVTLSDAVFKLVESQRQRLLSGILGIQDGHCADEFQDNYHIFTEGNSIGDARAVISLARVTKGFSKVDYDWCMPKYRVHDEFSLKMLKRPVFSVGQCIDNYYDEDSVRGIIITNEEDKYCFVVPSHMLVLRRKGCVFITGDCSSH